MPSDLVLQALSKPVSDLTVDDIRLIASSSVLEDTQTEFKREVPGGSWQSKQTIDNAARDGLLKEIIAFANTFGGTLFVGIDETSDEPKRSAGLAEVPNVGDLAARLSDRMRDCVDPRLLSPQVREIITDSSTGSGVLIVRISSSPLAPHWNRSAGKCYRRILSSSQEIGMMEIQRLTLERAKTSDDIKALFVSRAFESGKDFEEYKAYRKAELDKRGHLQGELWGYGIRATAIPTIPVRLDKSITTRDDLKIGMHVIPIIYSPGRSGTFGSRGSIVPGYFRPALRSWNASFTLDFKQDLVVRADGLLENRIIDFPAHAGPGHGQLQTNFLFAEVIGAIMRAERFKKLTANDGVPYEIELEAKVVGDVEVYLSSAAEQPGVFKFYHPSTIFPRILYEDRSQLADIVEAVQHDVINAMGRRIDEHIPLFKLDFDQVWPYIDGPSF